MIKCMAWKVLLILLGVLEEREAMAREDSCMAVHEGGRLVASPLEVELHLGANQEEAFRRMANPEVGLEVEEGVEMCRVDAS
jgi:hypothetical protein